jgi:hypothetical protein
MAREQAAYITTPNVVNVARAHFSCPTLTGGETENLGGSGSGGDGTRLSAHWESRIYKVRRFPSNVSYTAELLPHEPPSLGGPLRLASDVQQWKCSFCKILSAHACRVS